VSESAHNTLLANELYKAANQTIDEFDGTITIVPFGAALISITNAEQIKKDSLFAVSVALLLILLLLYYFFRSVKPLFFIAISIAFGALFSLGLIVLFKSTVSIIALGISSIILGIAINYPLHFLAHFRHNSNVQQTIKEIVNPLVIGNITTVGAFLSMLFISSDAMNDLGLSASFLLVGTIVFVLIFLPHFLGGKELGGVKGVKKLREVRGLQFGKLAEFSPERHSYIVLIFLCATVVLFFFSFGTKFETNLHAINYMTAEQRAQMNVLIEQNKDKGETIYIVAEGANVEQALQNYEKFIVPHVHNFTEKSGISNFFPSKELQQQKIERWNEFWEWNDGAEHECSKKDLCIGNFKAAAEQQGFNERVFENFITTLNNDFQPQEFDYFAPIYSGLGENYFSISKDKTLIYTLFKANNNSSNSLTPFNSSNSSIFTFDNTSIATKMVDALSADFNRVLFLCAFVVFAFLFFSFRRIELAILTFIPLTVAWIWILGLMNIFDMKFNIVNIILATFIFGQGDDYTIFVTEGLIYEYSRGKRMLASFKNSIILSATILFIAIGMLIFAKHPAMRSLAELAIVGMISVVMCAYLFPPLIFRFLTTKKGALREVPFTLKRWIRGVYAFSAFLLGCCALTVYGFILFGVKKLKGVKGVRGVRGVKRS
jgi:predicted exporter